MEMILIVLFLIISLAIFVIALYQCLKWYKKFSFKSDPEDPKDMERYRELYEHAFLDVPLDDPSMQDYDKNTIAELSRQYAMRPKFIMISQDHELWKDGRLHQLLQIVFIVAVYILFMHAQSYITTQRHTADWMVAFFVFSNLAMAIGFMYVFIKVALLDGLFIDNIALAVDSTATILKYVTKRTTYYSIHRVFDYQVHERYILIHGRFTSPVTGASLPGLNYKGLKVARLFAREDERLFLKRLDELKEENSLSGGFHAEGYQAQTTE